MALWLWGRPGEIWLSHKGGNITGPYTASQMLGIPTPECPLSGHIRSTAEEAYLTHPDIFFSPANTEISQSSWRECGRGSRTRTTIVIIFFETVERQQSKYKLWHWVHFYSIFPPFQNTKMSVLFSGQKWSKNFLHKGMNQWEKTNTKRSTGTCCIAQRSLPNILW